MNRYSDMTIWQLREELAAVKAELAARDVTTREPNAALGMEHHNDASAGPAPAAPDVASVVKWLMGRKREEVSCNTCHQLRYKDREANSLERQAAAILAKLGQGWIPPTEQQEAEAMRDILERQRKRSKAGASDD